MKITGATSLDSPVGGIAFVPEVPAVCCAGQPVDTTARDSVVEGQLSEDKIQGGADTPDFKGWVDHVAGHEALFPEVEGPFFDVQGALEGDDDLLDLLVETLDDDDYDTNLLV